MGHDAITSFQPYHFTNPDVQRKSTMTEWLLAEQNELGRARGMEGVPERVKYRLLAEPELSQQLKDKSKVHYHNLSSGGSVQTLSFQPCPAPSPYSYTQDRSAVQEWTLRNGTWTFYAVFDGHRGHKNVDYVSSELPNSIRRALEDLLGEDRQPSHVEIRHCIRDSILAFDEALGKDVLGIFPEGVDHLSDDDIRNVLQASPCREAYALKLDRAFQGTVAVITLLDPSKDNLYNASVGDCFSALATELPHNKWEVFMLAEAHNCYNLQELKRIRKAHPGEPDLSKDALLLGHLGMTRAIGDWHFKLPAPLGRRLFNIYDPIESSPFLVRLFPRIQTPPYLTAHPDVLHVNLGRSKRKAKNVNLKQVVLLATDGLDDLYRSWSRVQIMHRLAPLATSSDPAETPVIRILRDALGGDDHDRLSRCLTLDLDVAWLDDLTVLVHQVDGLPPRINRTTASLGIGAMTMF